MIPKDDGQLRARLADFVRSIHPIRIAHGTAIIPADKTLRRLPKDFLVGGEPTDAVLAQERQHFLTYRPLGRPHAHGRFAEDLGMLLDRPPHLHDGVVRITAGEAW